MKGMTDKDIWALIGQTEREGMLDPPAGFKDEVLFKIRQKRKRRKDMQLFSYSAKVLITMAAALFVLFTIPATIDPQAWLSERLPVRREESVQMPGFEQNQNTRPEDANRNWVSDADLLLGRISLTLDQYCGKVNDGLDRLIRWRE